MHKTPAKYLVLIEADGTVLAKLYDAQRAHVADVDATSEEVGVMTRGLTPEAGANAAPWAQILSGHGTRERAEARIYTLDV